MRINRNWLTDKTGKRGEKNRCLSLFLRVIARSVSDEAIFFLFLLCALVFFPKFVFAGASLSLSGGNWDLGTKVTSSESTSASNNWTVTNNNSSGTEDVLIQVTSTGAWTASTDATLTNNEFLLRKDNTSGQIITGTDGALITGLVNNGTYSFGLYFKSPPSGSELGAHTLTVTLTATNWVFACGTNLVGTDAITYGTVSTNLAGPTTSDNKCWITRNLGATAQAISVDDGADAAAGSYYQFGKVTPGWQSGWTYATIWNIATDPCASLLGTGWRLPTFVEWTYADSASGGNWTTWSGPFASVLKLHAAGYLYNTDGTLGYRGSNGYYWSSSLFDSTSGVLLTFSITNSALVGIDMAYGISVRCLKD